MDHGDYEHVGFWMILIVLGLSRHLLSWVLNSSSMFWQCLRRVRAACPVQLHQVGITPLFLAVRGGHSQIVQFLCGSPSSRWNCSWNCSSGAKTKSEARMIHLYFLHFVGQVDHSYLWWSVCPSSSYCILYDWLIYWYIYICLLYVCREGMISVSGAQVQPRQMSTRHCRTVDAPLFTWLAARAIRVPLLRLSWLLG